MEWDPYEILNIDRVSVSEHKQRECVPCLSTGATIAEIKHHYRRLSMQHHPDRGGDQDTFLKIAKAYEACVTLSSIMSCCDQLFFCVSAV